MVTHTGTRTIETKRLLLRRFEYSDIDSMLRNWIADEQTQWDYGEPSYSTPEAVRELFDTKYIASYIRAVIIGGRSLRKNRVNASGRSPFFDCSSYFQCIVIVAQRERMNAPCRMRLNHI